MGKKNSSGKKHSRTSKRNKKRKEISPQQGNFEKKLKCTDLNKTSEASENSSVLCDDTSAFCDNNFSPLSTGNMSYLENKPQPQSLANEDTQNIVTGNNTLVDPVIMPSMNPAQVMLPHQHFFSGMPVPLAMSSPIPGPIQSQQHSILSDSDIARLAEVLKSALKHEIETMVSLHIDNKLAPLKQEIQQLREDNNSLRSQLNDVQMRQDRSEQYGRKCNARICNYPFNKNENTNDIVCSVAKDVGVTIQPDEIDVSHRTGKIKDDKPREIIVKFATVSAKSKFMKCRKLLREKRSSTFVCEDLTDARNGLLFRCRQLKKVSESNVEKAWSFNGNVFIKVKDTDDPVKIQSLADLDKYTPKPVSTM